MNLGKIEGFKTFLTAQMNAWILFSVALTLMILSGESSFHMARWCVLSLYPFLLYLIRRKDWSFSAFIGCHLLLGTVLLLLPASGILVWGLSGAFVAAFTVYSIYLRMNTKSWQDKVIPPMVATGMLFVMMIVLHTQGEGGREPYYILLGVIYFCLYFVYSYTVQYLHFIKVNESSAGYIPVRKMFVTGMKMTVPYTITCGILLLVAGNVSIINKIIDFVKKVLFHILSFLLRNAGGGEEGPVTEELAEEILQEAPAGEAFLPGKSFWFWEVVEKIGFFLVALLIIAAVVTAFRHILRFIRKAFARRRKKFELMVESQPDERENCEVERRVSLKKFKNPFLLFSNREHIRRIYRKRMKKEACIKPSKTARECCGEFEALPLAQIYEKARYSETECSAMDLKEAKKWQ